MKFIPSFQHTSIRGKLLSVVAFYCSFAMFLAGCIFISYEFVQSRAGATREINSLAGIVAASTTAALSFSDENAVLETLATLSTDQRLTRAIVYTKEDRLFAEYHRKPGVDNSLAKKNHPDGSYFEGDSLFLYFPILLRGDRIGTVVLQSSMNEVYARLRRYCGIVVLVLLTILGLASRLSSRLQRLICDPIVALASVAQRVSVDKDYSVRATWHSSDEIGLLVDSFNGMLAQIEIRDIARKVAEDLLRESEERYALAAHGANDGLWDWKLSTNEIYFSPRWTRMLGHSDNEIGSDPEEWFRRIHPNDINRVRAQISAHCDGATPEFYSEYRMLHRNGSHVWMLSRGMAVRNLAGVAFRMAGSQTDITEGKVADALTELPNRIYFTERLDRAIEIGKNPESDFFAVLFLDLDRFKLINDSLGHASGDQLLVEIAKRLRVSVSSSCASGKREGPCVVARLGGDEFAVLIEGIRRQEDAIAVAERILKQIGAAFSLSGRQVFINFSIGIAMGSSGHTSEDLLRNADTAMYYAKARGKSLIEVFDDGMRDRAIARMQIETDLAKAIHGDELVLHYQPKLSLTDQLITGFEALVRWNHPERGLLYPGEFIPVAEEIGLIVPLGRWVLRQACRQLAVWHRDEIGDPAITISVNISFKQLAEEGLVEDVQRILAETGLKPEHLRLEITESSIMENADMAVRTLRRFKDMRIGLEIDDFGTGYSSLSYLRQLPFDTVKIDRSFVKELGTDDDTSDIIKTILQLAWSLGMDVVAEGVETKDQLERLKVLGSSHGQGYYFSKPIDAVAAQRLMLEQKLLKPATRRIVNPIPTLAAVSRTLSIRPNIATTKNPKVVVT